MNLATAQHSTAQHSKLKATSQIKHYDHDLQLSKEREALIDHFVEYHVHEKIKDIAVKDKVSFHVYNHKDALH